MEKNADAGILMSIKRWVDQLKSVPSLTTSNSEELKNHLLDTMDNLKAAGLDDEEAFWIASRRLGDISILKDEYDEVNMPVIQMRKIILVFSGILVFFLLYSLMHLTTKLLFFVLYQINYNPAEIIRYVVIYLSAYHFIFIFCTILLYFFGKRIVTGIKKLNFKPRHTILLFAGVFCIVVINLWFQNTIREIFDPDIRTLTKYYATFDYSGYTFPLIIIICFLMLYKRYYSASSIVEILHGGLPQESNMLKEDAIIETRVNLTGGECLKNKFSVQWEKLKEIGLDEEEASGVLLKRQGLELPHKDEYNAVNQSESTMMTFLTVLSGVLVYFFLYYLQNSAARILLTVLQHFENDAILNIRRTWTFVIAFHFILIFFATSVYLLDMNVIQRFKRIIIKPVHTKWLLFATIFLALVDRCFSPISKNAIGYELALKFEFENIFNISQYSLLFVVGVCFLILFNKYYHNNIKIG
jgi:hypothetical protein